MRRMGFYNRWIHLIMMCVTSVSYSILVNGKPCGSITPTRGTRQGDPISPYLFLLCGKALSSLLIQASSDGRLIGVPISKRGPRVSRLLFTDDNLLFCRANMEQWNNMTDILQLYENSSRQKMNQNKTVLFFSKNTLVADKTQILEVAGIPDSCGQIENDGLLKYS